MDGQEKQKDCPHVLVLTPMKNAARYLDSYFRLLDRLDHPPGCLSLGILEGDSSDGTFEALQARMPALQEKYRKATLWQKHYGFSMPPHLPRWTPAFQYPRRVVLAKSRNYLLFCALGDADWVLWLDCDITDYPPDVLKRLLATGHGIVHPHCVTEWGGNSFDLNAWRDKGRMHLHDMRGGAPLQRLDAVGATMLLVKADIHREGLIFPPFAFGEAHAAVRDQCPCLPAGRRGEIESEGLGIMALAMGHQCWAMPGLEILHADE